ncbi:MAG: hypothetical protein DRP87_02735 [Spirochaetes bacterium]|nr:MAG: hypothetical protein DRP87_02735 [Spirochaetota bacterium]
MHSPQWVERFSYDSRGNRTVKTNG